MHVQQANNSMQEPQPNPNKLQQGSRPHFKYALCSRVSMTMLLDWTTLPESSSKQHVNFTTQPTLGVQASFLFARPDPQPMSSGCAYYYLDMGLPCCKAFTIHKTQPQLSLMTSLSQKICRRLSA